MTASSLQQLIRHMTWADARVWSAVLESEASHADPDTHTRFHHVHAVQRVYVGIWRGKAVELPEGSAFDDLPAICSWGQDCHADLATYGASLDSAALDRQVEFPWSEQLVERWGEVGPVTLGESVLQVALHSTHHRGQATARLRELGGEPPLVDFVAWLWQGEPDPEWPGTVRP